MEIIKNQGIEVIGIFFKTPFNSNFTSHQGPGVGLIPKEDIEIKVISLLTQYLSIIKKPCFGFGRNFNPCIDCRIFMLKKAGELLSKFGADFIITGEVLGQRPMSQNKNTLRMIEKKSGLGGLLLRPLSALLFDETIPEEKGWVNRDKLFAFSGRSRKPQLDLAKNLNLSGFQQPAGGCLLTDPGFSRRLKDLREHKPDFDLEDVELLKIGRHFRLHPQVNPVRSNPDKRRDAFCRDAAPLAGTSNGVKLIVGRNEKENSRLLRYARRRDYILEPENTAGPTGLLRLVDSGSTPFTWLRLSTQIIAHYCDHKENITVVIRNSIKELQPSRPSRAIQSELIDTLRI